MMKTTPIPALALIGALAACQSDPTPPAAAAAAAAPPSQAKPDEKAPAQDVAPAAAAAPSAVPGVPPPSKLPPLRAPAGPDAEGNAPGDVAAALKAATCQFDDKGDLRKCPAKDEYVKVRSNFVVAKADAHSRTVFNLLSAKSPAVRAMVLETRPLFYISVYSKELAEQWSTYEPLVSAALSETHSGVRRNFAWALTDVPHFESDPTKIGYLGAVGEAYSTAEEGEQIVLRLEELLNEECTQCMGALLGIAARNRDPMMRQAAITRLSDEEVDPAVYCPLALANVDVDTKALDPDRFDADDVAGIAVDNLVHATPKCDPQIDAWIATFEDKARKHALSKDWVYAATDLAYGEEGKKRVPRLKALGKTLAPLVVADSELSDGVQDLIDLEAS